MSEAEGGKETGNTIWVQACKGGQVCRQDKTP